MSRIPKKAMLPFTLQNSRGFVCGNVAGKVVAKAVGLQLVGPLAAEAGGRQHGAVPRGGTEFPSHACRLFLKEAARTRRPAAVLFHGLGQCFLLCSSGAGFGSRFDLPKKAQVFDALDIAHEQRVRLEELIRSEDTLIKRQEVAECWCKMAADFHKEPWFWVSGSRKRDPLADVVFALTYPLATWEVPLRRKAKLKFSQK